MKETKVYIHLWNSPAGRLQASHLTTLGLGFFYKMGVAHRIFLRTSNYQLTLASVFEFKR